jgi:hypothetical protein
MTGLVGWFRSVGESVREGVGRHVQEAARRKASLLTDAAAAALLFVGNLAVLGPYIFTEFNDQPWNNGLLYMAYARAFRDLPWTWNPLMYCGAPLRYLYPPLMHLFIYLLPVSSLARGYHFATAFAYALIPVCVYALGRVVFRSRIPALLAAILCSFYPCPAYYFLPAWRNIAATQAGGPWAFVTLVHYEEACHAMAFSFELLAVAAAWRNRWTWAALLAAAVCLINWPGMVGLLMVMAAVGVARLAERGWRQSALGVFGAMGIAYGVSAFWITPGYLSAVLLANRIEYRYRFPAAQWDTMVTIVVAAGVLLLLLALWRRLPREVALLLAWNAIAGTVLFAFTLSGYSLVPQPNRYMLEFNASLGLALSGLIWLLRRWRAAMAVAALGVLCAGAPAAVHFVSNAWKVQPRRVDRREILGYQIAQWLNQYGASGQRASGHVMAAGELEGELLLWSNVPQVGGPDTGMTNFLALAAQRRQIALGCEANSERIAELWLRALNVQYFVVHGGDSREYFHWFSQPGKFSALPVAWNNGAGDTIYRVPDYRASDAVVVDLAEMERLPRLRSTADAESLAAYDAWATGKRPASIRWDAPDRAIIDAQPGPDEGILIKTNYDRGWRATGARTESDPIGFLVIRSKSHAQRFQVDFDAPWDVWLGRAITLATVVLLFTRLPRHWIAVLALVPAVAAVAILDRAAPPTVAVAEETFIRVRPPTINPTGIVDAETLRQPPLGRGRPVTVWGTNFGSSSDNPIVWVGDRSAQIVNRSPFTITFKMPGDAGAKVPVSVEVNGCRGNEFTVGVR